MRMNDLKTWVCIASGPSLEDWQIDYIKKYKDRLVVMAISDNYKKAPWADIVFAADRAWWKHNIDEVSSSCPDSELWTLGDHNPFPDKIHGTKHRTDIDLTDKSSVYHGGNSGQIGIHLAYNLGAKKIIMVGYDFQKTDGKSHWFGDHPKIFKKNADGHERWNENFKEFSLHLSNAGVSLVNCSIQTAITSVRRSYLTSEIY